MKTSTIPGALTCTNLHGLAILTVSKNVTKGPAQARLVVRRALRQIAEMAIPKRRARSCPRALRQPVSSWPRLRKNSYRMGSPEYSVGKIYA